MKSIIATVAIFLTLITPVYAQVSDTFIINQTIGSDTTPPSVPVSLIATPITTSQINLSWATSTDSESSVGGYQVFRNDVQIATTTATSYSDTGLTASTTYDYNITAFDTFSNLSARSATSSTTTLPVVVVPSTTPSSNETRDIELEPIPLSIEDIEVTVSPTTATVSFNTPSYTIATLQVGTSQAYELTSLARSIYSQSHGFTVDGLTPQVKYYFKIVVMNHRGESFQYEGTFITSSLGVTPLPQNVVDFTATPMRDDVVLTWQNPMQPDFARVRIVANPSFYPTDELDGYLIYEGTGESYRHEAVYPQNQQMYYAIFAVNEAGKFSSGALAMVVFKAPEVLVSPATSTPPVTATTTPAWDLSFSDLIFLQGNRYKTGSLDVVALNPYEPFTIMVPYESVVPHLKSIIVTLRDPHDSSKTFAFMLRINEDKTHYEATIGALERLARFPLTLDLYDFKLKTQFEVKGVIDTGRGQVPTAATTTNEITTFASRCWWCWLLIALVEFLVFTIVHRITRPRPKH